MLTCQFVHMSVFLGTACEVVRRSCWRKDNGTILGVRLLLSCIRSSAGFHQELIMFQLSNVKSLCQIKLHHVNETASLIVKTDSSWLSVNTLRDQTEVTVNSR